MKKSDVEKINPSEIISAIIIILGVTSLAVESLSSICNRAGFILGAINIVFLGRKKSIIPTVLVIIIITFTLGIINNILVHQQAFQNYIITGISYLSVALFLSETKKPNLIIWKAIAFYITVITMYYWIHSPDGYLLFYSTGRNYVSVYLLEALCFLYIVYDKYAKKMSYIFFVLFFACCVSAIGRMGILVSGFLLAGVFCSRTFGNNKLSKTKRALLVGATLLGFIFLAIFVVRYQEIIINRFFTRFISDKTTSDSDQSRLEILKAYIAEINNLKSLIFGANTHNIKFLDQWNGNLHNSYLLTHASYGIIGVSIIFISIFKFVVITLREKKRELLLVLCVFAIRCLTDNVLDGQPGDIIMWFIILYPVYYARRKRNVRIL